MPGHDFSGRIVIVAGAGCPEGAVLARGFAGMGARVVVMDCDEGRSLSLANAHPDRIDTLRLDVLRPDHCRHFGLVWEDEPLHVLLHLQLLRYRNRPAMALRSVARLTQALQPALETARGQVFYFCPDPDDDPTVQSLDAACAAMAGIVQNGLGGNGAAINGVKLPKGGLPSVGETAFLALMARLATTDAARFGGTILPVLPRSD